ncbi:MAG: hypothetical protein Q7S22_03390 [Candidatus Micrarchaeota archaeon]|nr:hypothetical protein [Candidatus Micrarchaeota archaeon]
MNPTAYDILTVQWRSTCRILFGQELGELKEFEYYLKPAAIGQTVISSISGKPAWVASDHYSKKAKFFDYENELSEFVKISSKPLDINQIKDTDSLVQSLKERFVYSGNKVLGNSKYIEHSDAVVDSTGVLNSSIVEKSKYVAYGYLAREVENYFGSMSSGQSSHIVRCFYNNTLKRCFECCTTIGTSDSYFCYNLLQCTDCLFSFNLRGKRYHVANVELEKSQYLKLKTKLLVEISDELKKKKKLDYSIMDLMNNA